MTYYLKYRPQKIDELDLVSVREALGRIFKSENIPHAFLFSGPRGAGKTSAARIVAKALNCEQMAGNTGEPCNECATCVAITNGSCLDVIEIDAASNRGVDDMRALREGVKLATAGSAKRVYIIDEAHMLTTEASNALLKTLEEPPGHVVFVLATTNPGKLLDTIRSRCTTVVFPKASEEEIVRSLEKAVKGEKLKVEEGALEEIEKKVDGSFREAHKVLEQLSLGREKIALKDVEELFSVSPSSVDEFLKCLAKQDIKTALEEIEKVASAGADLKAWTTQVLSTLRGVLLQEYGLTFKGHLTSQGVTLRGWKVEDFGGIEKLTRAIELFSQGALSIPTSVIPQLPLELAVVRLLSDRTGPLSLSNNSPSSDTSDVHELSDALSSEEEAEEEKAAVGHPELDLGSTQSATGEELGEKWKLVMQQVKPKNHSIEALLRATKPKDFDGRVLTIEVFYQFHKERIEKDPYRSLVEQIAGEVLGSPVKITCTLSTQKQKARDIANVTEEVEEDIVRIAEEVFGANTGDSDNLPN